VGLDVRTSAPVRYQQRFWQTNNAKQQFKISTNKKAKQQFRLDVIKSPTCSNTPTLHVTSDKTLLLQIFAQRQLASAYIFNHQKQSFIVQLFFNFSFANTLWLTKVLWFDKTQLFITHRLTQLYSAIKVV